MHRAVLLRMGNVSDKSCTETETHFMFNDSVSKTMKFMTSCGKILYRRTGHRRRYGLCALHAGYLSYKHTLRICTIYCFSTSTTVARTKLNVTLHVQLVLLFHSRTARYCLQNTSARIGDECRHKKVLISNFCTPKCRTHKPCSLQ